MGSKGDIVKSFKQYLNEEVSKQQLNQVEDFADKLFKAIGLDIDFTKHFADRVNDSRNKSPITPAELIRLFKETYKKYGKVIAKLGDKAEAVIKDMMTDINMPFVLNLKKDGMLHLIAKTILRKKDFKTSNKKYTI